MLRRNPNGRPLFDAVTWTDPVLGNTGHVDEGDAEVELELELGDDDELATEVVLLSDEIADDASVIELTLSVDEAEAESVAV